MGHNRGICETVNTAKTIDSIGFSQERREKITFPLLCMGNILQQHERSPTAETPFVSNAAFARQLGRTPITIWRWQKQGWLDPSINIAGKPYLSREAIERFKRRANAGEFARAPHVPRREKGGVVT